MTVGKVIAQEITLADGWYSGDPRYFAVYRYNNAFDGGAAYLLATQESDVLRAAHGGYCANLTKLWQQKEGMTMAGVTGIWKGQSMSLIQTNISGFAEYHKIDTLFERGDDFVVDPSHLKKSVLATISEWDVTEKIDGTNIRVMLSESGEVQLGWRTNNAQIPADLIIRLLQMFPVDKMKAAFWIDGNPSQAILYGEGYGAGIQKGGTYRSDKSFILYDVLCGGKWWLDRTAVDDVATKLGIDTVPYLGRMKLNQIISLVRNPFPSKIGTGMAEGIVARPIETLFDKRGERIIIKLKTRDFVKDEIHNGRCRLA
jgi:hypothetical protein